MHFHRDEFDLQFDEFNIVGGDILPDEINKMLDKYESAIMIWSPEYFQEIGWASIEKNAILNRRVYEKKRFVPILLKGKRSMIPKVFAHFVSVDMRGYNENKDPVLFTKRMNEVIIGLKKND